MNRLLKIMLSILIIYSTVIPVLAEDNVYSKYNAQELELISELEATDPSFDIRNGEILSITKRIGYMTEEGFIDIEEYNSNDRGLIDPSLMSLIISVQRTQTQQSTYDYFIFTSKAQWLSVPTVRSLDILAIAWSDNFTMHASDCKAYYSILGYVSGKTQIENTVPEAGVSYRVETSHTSNHANYPISYVVEHAYVKKINSTDTANVMTKYAHKTLTIGSLSSSITGAPSILFSISLTGTYDTMVASTSFNY